MDPSYLRVTLLGAPLLSLAEQPPQRLNRKSAGLLAYLAIKGETRRGTVAGLLWPEAREATSRNNLAQTIRRLRSAAGGADWLGGGERLILTPAVDVDVAQVGSAFRAQRHTEVAAYSGGRLLSDYDYSDCEDFDGWLHGERERVDAIRRESLIALIHHLERSGEYRLAVGYARTLVDLDPCREESHRHLMRLYSLLGDRAAALKAYHFCQSVLRRELGLSPMPETAGLAHAIEQGIASSNHGVPETQSSDTCSPLLERGAAWQAMESAWARHQAILIVGEAGAGKTRLMQEFLASKTRAVCVAACPEEHGTPYATLSRIYRQLLSVAPSPALQAWALGELAHLLPELGTPTPPNLLGAAKLRLLRAQLTLLQACAGAGVSCVALDDLQFADAGSVETCLTLLVQHGTQADGMRVLYSVERGALPPERWGALQSMAARGELVVVEVRALSLSGAQHLLAERVGDAEVAEIHHQSGGNPALMLALARTWASTRASTLTGEVRAMLQSRLSRLAQDVLELARIAAAAGDGFGIELAGRVLDRHPMTLIDAWQALENAGLLVKGRLAPPVFARMVRDGLPPSVIETIELACGNGARS